MDIIRACSRVSWLCRLLVNVRYRFSQYDASSILTNDLETDGYIDNPTQKGWLTAILELGAWFGALMSGFVAESLSRKYGILAATGVFIIGVVVQITAIAGGHNEILAGRFIT
jgi:MFS family permease